MSASRKSKMPVSRFFEEDGSDEDSSGEEDSDDSDEEEDVKPPKCSLCNGLHESELNCGKIRTSYREKISAHEFCMFFSPKLKQYEKYAYNGLDGFSPQDVLTEQRRGSKLKCTYCKKNGAHIGCCVKSCRVSFHLGCGRKNGSFHEFFGQYRSFCKDHVPDMPITKKRKQMETRIDRKRKRQQLSTEPTFVFHGTVDIRCPLCFEFMPARSSRTVTFATCCDGAAFHHACIQKQALNAGAAHFRCPLCNNGHEFTTDMMACGIYIPERDASWELNRGFYA